NHRDVYGRDIVLWLIKLCYNITSCLNSVWFLVVKLENGNPPTYYIIQVINRILLDAILTYRAHQINEIIHPKTVVEFLDRIILVFVERFEVGLATIFLIAHLIFEGVFLSTLFRVDCTNSDFTECKTKIDLELESHGDGALVEELLFAYIIPVELFIGVVE
ncbi:11277_t:CDS:2, partial [Diversispora eburnea]